MIRPMQIPQQDWKEAYDLIDERLFQASLMKLVDDSYVPKNLSVERFRDMLRLSVQKKSTDTGWNELLTELYGEKARNIECSIFNGCREITRTPIRVLFGIIKEMLLKEYGEFAYEDTV